jgi:hypothetical protein
MEFFRSFDVVRDDGIGAGAGELAVDADRLHRGRLIGRAGPTSNARFELRWSERAQVLQLRQGFDQALDEHRERIGAFLRCRDHHDLVLVFPEDQQT